MTDNYEKFFLKEGDEVAHRENLNLKMEVRKIIKKKKVSKDGDGKVRIFTLGIECGWWGNGNEYNKETFHTNVLIPWDIAEEGYVNVVKYLDEKNKIKQKK